MILYRECLAIIWVTLVDAGTDHSRREKVAVFKSEAADTLRAADPAFSYEWFFGRAGKDNSASTRSVGRMPASLPFAA